MKRVTPAILLCASLLLTLRADAAFHLMSIVEVFPGTATAPTAQFIELQMYAAGQNLVAGHSITVHDASGTIVGTFSFPGNVSNGANQARVLIATSQAQTTFGVTANLTMTSSIALAGGKVCFDSIDCVSWGNYSGPPADAGTPFAAGTGLVLGQSMQRRLDISGGATTLESTDDTNNSATNFVLAQPTPTNNAGQNGSLPPGAPAAVPLPAFGALLLGSFLLLAGGVIASRRPRAPS
ncbi:MAG TPA: hypothetical protein VJN18_06955 [Polyangiaceae bacterium]|nr:hypothetical protein [Polyangiaceae bacterium]